MQGPRKLGLFSTLQLVHETSFKGPYYVRTSTSTFFFLFQGDILLRMSTGPREFERRGKR